MQGIVFLYVRMFLSDGGVLNQTLFYRLKYMLTFNSRKLNQFSNPSKVNSAMLRLS